MLLCCCVFGNSVSQVNSTITHCPEQKKKKKKKKKEKKRKKF